MQMACGKSGRRVRHPTRGEHQHFGFITTITLRIAIYPNSNPMHGVDSRSMLVNHGLEVIMNPSGRLRLQRSVRRSELWEQPDKIIYCFSEKAEGLCRHVVLDMKPLDNQIGARMHLFYGSELGEDGLIFNPSRACRLKSVALYQHCRSFQYRACRSKQSRVTATLTWVVRGVKALFSKLITNTE